MFSGISPMISDRMLSRRVRANIAAELEGFPGSKGKQFSGKW